jgi:hypothetical protein
MPTTAKTGARYTGIPATVLAAVRTISGFASAPRLIIIEQDPKFLNLNNLFVFGFQMASDNFGK